MQCLRVLYLVSTFLYTMILSICWVDKLTDYFEYKNVKLKSLFKFYDLGVVIFPLSILMIILIIVIALICEVESKISESKFFNKNLFK